MTFYLANFFFFLGYSALLKLKGKEKILWWLSLVQFSFIEAFRASSVGTDTAAYSRTYYLVSRINGIDKYINGRISGLFAILSPVAHILPYSFMWSILTGIIINLLIWIYIRLDSKDYGLSVFLYLTCYFYYTSMNAGRQYIAIALSMITISFITRKKYLIAVPFFLLAIIIHAGGTIILSLAFGIYLISWNLKRYVAWLALCFISSFFIPFLQELFQLFFVDYAQYSYERAVSQGRMIYFNFFIFIFVMYSALVICHKDNGKIKISNFYSHSEDKNADFEIHYLWGLIILVSLQLVFCIMLPNHIFISRATEVFSVLSITLLPNILKEKTKISLVMKAILMIGTFGYMILRLYGNYGQIIPYKTFISY